MKKGFIVGNDVIFQEKLIFQLNRIIMCCCPLLIDSIQMAEDIENTDSLFIDLSTLRAATGNFSESNRIGEGGFGSVYKVQSYISHFI